MKMTAHALLHYISTALQQRLAKHREIKIFFTVKEKVYQVKQGQLGTLK